MAALRAEGEEFKDDDPFFYRQPLAATSISITDIFGIIYLCIFALLCNSSQTISLICKMTFLCSACNTCVELEFS